MSENLMKKWLKNLFQTATGKPLSRRPRSRFQPLLEAMEDRVVPAIVVNTTDDNTTVDSFTTLREAIIQANTQGGDDVIEFDSVAFASPGPYTIQLNTVLPNLDSNIAITGPGANVLTVRGQAGDANYRLFTITSGKTVSISGLTMSNARASGTNGASATAGQGGAIFNSGSLTITGCEFTGNSAVGGSGSAALQSGAVGQGGAIYHNGTLLIVQNSTFSGNLATGGAGGNGAHINTNQTSGFETGGPGAAGQGGAIYADAPSGVTITNSTFYSNSANGGGGGGSGYSNQPSNSGTGGAGGNGAGGAIYSVQAVTLVSTTIAANTTSGGTGGYNNNFSNVGTGGNSSGGGIFSGGTVTIGNTLVAINSANPGYSDVTPGTAVGPDVSGTFSSNDFNLISVLTASANGFTGAADQTGTEAVPVEAKLDPMGAQDNGGPTRTVRLRKGSAAVDKGKDLGPVGVDQRGFLRPKDFDSSFYANAPGGDGTDIGAYEAASLPNDLPQLNSPQSVNGAVGTELVNQKVVANDADNDTLTYSIVDGTMPDGLTFNSDGTITGTPTTPGQSSVTFKANDGLEDSVMIATLNINITEAASLVVNTDTDVTSQYDGLTTLREAINFAANDSASTPVTFDATFFATAKIITLNPSNGPLGIFSFSVDITGPAAGVTISGGDAVKIMQIYDFGSNIAVNLRNLTFANGHVGAFSSGNAMSIFNTGGTPQVTLIGVTFKNNGGDDTKGGAIENAGGALTIVNSTFSGNHADDSGQSFGYAAGGAIYQSAGATTLINSTLSGNHSNGTGAAGGAINVAGGTLTLHNTIVAVNSATAGPDVFGAVVATSSFNLIGDGTDMTGISHGAQGNQIGSTGALIDPLFDGGLANHEGPTETFALKSTSPAVDKGKDLAPTSPVNLAGVDQRGKARPYDDTGIAPAADGDNSDIGAYELQPTAPEIDVQGNGVSILDGDVTPSTTDDTDFGEQLVASGTVVRTFTIKNTGNLPLNLTGNPIVAISGDATSADFTVTTQPTSPIAAGSSVTFQVTFNPSALGTRIATVSIVNDDADEGIYVFTISGFGTAPEINVQGNATTIDDGDNTPSTTDHTDFGDADILTGVVSRTFTIQNTGTATLNVTNIAIGGASDFTLNPAISLPQAIAPNGTFTFTIDFNPTTDGAKNATVTITSDDADEPSYDFAIKGNATSFVEIDVSGQGIEIPDGSTTPLVADDTDFGSVNVAGVTVSHTFKIANSGSRDATLSGSPIVTLSGGNAGDFTVSIQPSSSVTATGFTTFTVTFDPTAPGLRSTTVSFANDDPNENPYTFVIQGTGLAPEINLQGNGVSIVDGDTTPSAADDTDFGNQLIASGTVVRTFTIQNTGNTNLTLSGTPKVAVSGVNAADFTVTTQPTSPVSASGSVTFQVTFDPSAVGTRTATLTIASDDDSEASYDFVIQGTGTAPEIDVRGKNVSIVSGDVTPAVADDTNFGTVGVNGAQVDHVFTIHNLGTATLNLTGSPDRVTISGLNASDFSVFAQPAATAAANGGTTTFTIRFDPSATGVRKATISIANDDSNENPYVFDVQGAGQASLPYGPIDFSAVSSEPGPQLSGDWVQPLGNFSVQSGKLSGNAANNLAVVNLATPAANVFVEANVTVQLNKNVGLVARYTGVGERDMYLGSLSATSGGLVARIYRNVAGTWTQLATQDVGSGSGGLLRFEVVGNSLKLLFNGQLAVFAYDDMLTAAGRVGVRGSAQSTVDNFRADQFNSIATPMPVGPIDFQTQEAGPQLSEQWIEAVGNFGVQTNRLQGNADSALNLALVNLAAPAADVFVEANVTAQLNKNAGLVARYTGIGERNMYLGSLSNTSGGLIASIYRNVNGTWTSLASRNVGSGSGGLLRFEVVGNSLKLLFNGQLAVFAYDNSLTAAGLVGVRGSAQSTFDNFQANLLNPIAVPLPVGPIDFQSTEPGPQLSERWIETLGNLAVESNRLKGDPNSALNLAVVNVPASTTDGFIQATVSAPSVGEQVGLLARYNGPDDTNTYLAALSNVGGGNNVARIWKNVGGTWTVLKSVNVGSLTSGVLRFEQSGSTLTLKFNNNPAFTISIVDNSFAAGRFGVRGSKNATWDDVSAGA